MKCAFQDESMIRIEKKIMRELLQSVEQREKDFKTRVSKRLGNKQPFNVVYSILSKFCH